MTSIYLAQKLLSLKLSKDDLHEIRKRRKNNYIDKCHAIKELQDIHKKQESLKTCRLCLKPGDKAIFGEEQDIDYLLNIKDILGIEIHVDDGKPNHICSSCDSTLRATVQLKQTAEITQWRLDQEHELLSEPNEEIPKRPHQHRSYFVKEDTNIVRHWQCLKCRKKFNNKDDFYVHEKMRRCYRQPHHDLICICDICGQDLKNIKTLKVHRRIHGPPQHYCHLRVFSSRSKENLSNHIESQHSTEKAHKCYTCMRAFSTRRMLLKHERKVHKRPSMYAS